jgi:hypothetical protein
VEIHDSTFCGSNIDDMNESSAQVFVEVKSEDEVVGSVDILLADITKRKMYIFFIKVIIS